MRSAAVAAAVSVGLVGTAAVAAVPTALSAHAPKRLSVHTLNYSTVSGRDLTSALVTTADTYSVVGVTLEWRACAPPLDDRCPETTSTDDIRIRVVQGPTNLPGFARPLGVANLGPGEEAGGLATNYTGHASDFAAETGTRFERLLGLVITHELGHLVLASPAHSAFGLMQSVWSATSLQSTAREALHFSAQQGAELRAKLTRRPGRGGRVGLRIPDAVF